MNIELTEALFAILGLCLLFLLPMAMTQGLELEDYRNPGGWKFPKAEVMAFLSAIFALVILTSTAWVLANY